jgi:hypothetical protein
MAHFLAAIHTTGLYCKIPWPDVQRPLNFVLGSISAF